MSLLRRFASKRLAVTKSARTDTVVLAVLLLTLNSLFSPFDIGFTKLNPSPYLILPVLIGSRYGFGPGIFAGLSAVVVTMIGQWRLLDLSFTQTLALHGYYLGFLIGIGGICGEIQNYFRVRELQLEAIVENAKDRLKKLDTDLVMLREAKAELERVLATRDAELSTLDADLRRIFDSEQDELLQNLLLLFNRQCRVSDAGVYWLGEGETITRRAILGSDQFLPTELQMSEVEMISLAMRHKTTVTIPEFWQRAIGQHKNYLIASPLLDSRDEPMGVLIVTGMPFIALNKKTVHLITLICRWASRIIEIRTKASNAYRIVSGIESQRLFTTEFFKQTLDLAYQSFLQHNLPSSLVLFSLPTEPGARQDEFEKIMMATLRGGDFPATLGLPYPHLVVLLPLTGERGAHIFIDRIVLSFERTTSFSSDLNSELVIFDAKQTSEQLWERLTTPHAESLVTA